MINKQDVFNAAKDFKMGSDILRAKYGEESFPLRTTIVTTVFSIELYLKYLLINSGHLVRGHDLNDLFSRLPSDIQIKIKDCYKGSTTISDILGDYKNLFIEWRYIYEKQDGVFSINDIPSLILFRDALDFVSSELSI